MHNALGMTEVEGFEQFEDVVSDVEVCEFRVEGFEFRVLCDGGRRGWVSATVSMISIAVQGGSQVGWTAVGTGLTLTYSETIDGVFD